MHPFELKRLVNRLNNLKTDLVQENKRLSIQIIRWHIAHPYQQDPPIWISQNRGDIIENKHIINLLTLQVNSFQSELEIISRV